MWNWINSFIDGGDLALLRLADFLNLEAILKYSQVMKKKKKKKKKKNNNNNNNNNKRLSIGT